MFTVYGKEDCTYCVQAVELLKQNGEEFTYKKLGVDYSKEALLSIIGEFGVIPRSVPQIVKDGEYVGGYDALKNLLTAQKM